MISAWVETSVPVALSNGTTWRWGTSWLHVQGINKVWKWPCWRLNSSPPSSNSKLSTNASSSFKVKKRMPCFFLERFLDRLFCSETRSTSKAQIEEAGQKSDLPHAADHRGVPLARHGKKQDACVLTRWPEGYRATQPHFMISGSGQKTNQRTRNELHAARFLPN